jgi:hypothetical protein
VFLKADLVLLAVEPWFGSGIHVPMMPLPDVVELMLADPDLGRGPSNCA